MNRKDLIDAIDVIDYTYDNILKLRDKYGELHGENSKYNFTKDRHILAEAKHILVEFVFNGLYESNEK